MRLTQIFALAGGLIIGVIMYGTSIDATLTPEELNLIGSYSFVIGALCMVALFCGEFLICEHMVSKMRRHEKQAGEQADWVKTWVKMDGKWVEVWVERIDEEE